MNTMNTNTQGGILIEGLRKRYGEATVVDAPRKAIRIVFG